MAKRYLVCNIAGTGARDDPYRPGVRGLPGINVVGVIPTGADGRPTRDVCFARIGGVNLLPALTAAGSDPFPDFPLDAKLQAMQSATRSQLRTRIVARGFAGALVDNSDGFRDLVRGVGQSLEPTFNEDSFDVSDQPPLVAGRAGARAGGAFKVGKVWYADLVIGQVA